MADARDTGVTGRMSADTWYAVTVHNQETEAIQRVELAATTPCQAADMAVRFAFRELGWHRVRCHAVTDVVEAAS